MPSSSKGSLGVDSLGQPAEVLILRDELDDQGREGYLRSENDSMVHEDSRKDAMSSADMINEINAERGIIEADQVSENIDAVKHEWMRKRDVSLEDSESVFRTSHYEEIASKLYEGFTLPQLVAYLKRNLREISPSPLDLHQEYSCDLYSRSPWVAGTTDSWQVRAPVRKVEPHTTRSINAFCDNSDGSLSRKESVVDRILLYCWRLRPQEHDSTLGEMDMKLKSIHLGLIVKHERGILKQISETYGAKIEASTQNRAIRIISDYETSLDILKLIIYTIESIRSAVIEFPPDFGSNPQSISSHDLDNVILRHIMQPTNTIIKVKLSNSSNRELTVHYLGPDNGALEDVKRLITQTLRREHVGERKMILDGFDPQAEYSYVPIDVGSRIAIIDRSRQWSRWCSQSIRVVDSRDLSPTLDNPLYVKKIALALEKFLAIPDEQDKVFQRTSAHWLSSITYDDSVTLGQIIYSDYTRSLTQANRRPTKRAPREFVPLVPNLFNSLEEISQDKATTRVRTSEYLLIRLMPLSKEFSPGFSSALPDVEIEIGLDETNRTTAIRNVRLQHKKYLDIHLPQNTLDLRFMRRTCVYADINKLDPSIQHFIENSNLDIWGSTGRLKTPNELTLSIPAYALPSMHYNHTDASLEHKPIEYTFASLDHRSTITTSFYGSPDSPKNLTYTNIEAGKLGGRRDELSLSQTRQSGAVAESINRTYAESLLNATNTLVNKIESPPPPSGGGARQWDYGIDDPRGEAKRKRKKERHVPVRKVNAFGLRRARGVGRGYVGIG